MTVPLREQLERIPSGLRQELTQYRFDVALFEQFASRLRRGDIDNRTTGKVEAPGAKDVVELPPEGDPARRRLEQRGLAALERGECAVVVLAGGMATRMGGVVKALVEAVDGKSFLHLRLAEMDYWKRRVGQAPPFWLMTSQATEAGLRQALGARLDERNVALFSQRLSLRLTPEGDLFVDESGMPSEYAPGHGDLPEALQNSGLLQRFLEQGGRYVMVANVDNLGATLDPALIGLHLESGSAVTCEVVDKVGDDRGGIPALLDGKLVVLEEFRLPLGFEPSQVRVFNTNTIHFDASVLARYAEPFTYFAVNKKVGDTKVVQFERLLGEVTSFVSTAFVRVPRSGAAARFLPVKDNEELERRRDEIRAVLSARAVL